METGTNYFVCTLGQAAELDNQKKHHFDSVNALIDFQARHIPDNPAVAFHVPDAAQPYGTSSDSTQASNLHKHYSFADLRHGSCSVARRILDDDAQVAFKPTECVALLAQSTPLFLFTWLGLMRAGASVLLIAPQCQPAAISHLCRSCKVRTLLYDPKYADLAQQTSNDGVVRSVKIPDDWVGKTEQSRIPKDDSTKWPQVKDSDVAYLHHTSGTSSGLPKPIPQTHRAAVGVLPSLDGYSAATFTTTPLYHGGIADCFRSWTSAALIWLFPGSLPITSNNILASLASAKSAVQTSRFPAVKYFSSVPYVLQMLAAVPEGLAQLQNMDIVGVGGAALPEEAGNQLVEKGVNLISRFGSAECGYLMSSYRNFEKDGAWQYLRPGIALRRLRFESQDENIAELVVLENWPHLAKHNCEDRSYATYDLFTPHPSIPDAWKYHSRADSQLTLITGKKFDPTPLEDSMATSALVTDVLIFGDGKQHPGALLWRSKEAKDMGAQDVLEGIWPSINKINEGSQSHARLSKSMLIVLPVNTERPARSSKGTLLRKAVEEEFQQTIEEAYDRVSDAENLAADGANVRDGDIPRFLQSILRKFTGIEKEISTGADLFGQGVDSVACMQIRSVLQNSFGRDDGKTLPINVIYDCGTIEKLARYLVLYRKGESAAGDDELELMQQLVGKYGSFPLSTLRADGASKSNAPGVKRVYLLTGVTGALGAHILDQLMRREDVAKIVCLVRGADRHAACQRVAKSLQHRKCAANPNFIGKVTCLPAKLGEVYLGLSETQYADLAKEVDVIIHAAWAVNFSTRLRSFEQDHIGGIRNMIEFALASPEDQVPPQIIFCSSTASVISSESKEAGIREKISLTASDASPLGYSRSKWVAEAICAEANSRTRLKGRATVARVGQLCGDSRNGVWNMSEAWPMMLNASRRLGAIPDLGQEPLGWLPVDVAADALLKISDLKLNFPEDADVTGVFHVLRQGNDSVPTWNDAIQWAKSEMGPDQLWVVPLLTWIEELETLEVEHPAKKLIGLWRSRAEVNGTGKYESETDALSFDQSRALSVYPELNTRAPLDREMFGKLWSWIMQAHKL